MHETAELFPKPTLFGEPNSDLYKCGKWELTSHTSHIPLVGADRVTSCARRNLPASFQQESVICNVAIVSLDLSNRAAQRATYPRVRFAITISLLPSWLFLSSQRHSVARVIIHRDTTLHVCVCACARCVFVTFSLCHVNSRVPQRYNGIIFGRRRRQQRWCMTGGTMLVAR